MNDTVASVKTDNNVTKPNLTRTPEEGRGQWRRSEQLTYRERQKKVGGTPPPTLKRTEA